MRAAVNPRANCSGRAATISRSSKKSLKAGPPCMAPAGSIVQVFFVFGSGLPSALIAMELSVVRQSPTASKFSIPNPIGSILRWQLAHCGASWWSTTRSRAVSDLPASLDNCGMFGGAGGGGSLRSFRSTQAPRSTGLECSPLLPIAWTAAMPSRPPRGDPAGRDARRNSSPCTPSRP